MKKRSADAPHRKVSNLKSAIFPLMLTLLGCSGTLSAAGRANILYIENNNPAAGQNAVLGYTRNADGSLTDLAGSPFYTSGTGFRNQTEIIGPDDTDGELILSPDKLLLFAVNEGSNNISVFQVRLDGSLRLVPGSPFSSGGMFPCSLTWQNGFLYVTNRGTGILPTMVTPTYTPGTQGTTNFTVFSIAGNGALTQVPNSTVGVPDGSSPGQIVASNDGQFLWANVPFWPTNDAYVVPIFPQSQSRLLSFQADEDDGVLNDAGPEVFLPSSNPDFTIAGVNKSGFMLGLRPHPSLPLLYANAVLANTLAVWTWNTSGQLSFVGDAGAGPGPDPCWLAVDPMGRWAYAAAVHLNQVTAYSLSNPMAPKFLQNITLGGPQGPLPAGTPEPYGFTTAPFNISTDPTGTYLYVVNHATCTTTSVDATNCPVGNAIHVLKINSDGTVTEQANSPYIFPAEMVPANGRPKGLVVF